MSNETKLKRTLLVIAGAGTLFLFTIAWKANSPSSAKLEGTDANHNGVRDDVEEFIERSYRDEKTRIVARELHMSIQNAINHPEHWDWKRTTYAEDCLRYVNRKFARKIGSEIEAMTANTKERIRAYWKANARLSGGVYPVGAPSRKEACAFDPRLSAE